MSSLWRRAVRLAQSNINDIKDRATSVGRGRSLEEMSDAELERELERRQREREQRSEDREASERAAPSAGQSASTRSPDLDESEPVLEFLDLPPQKRREIKQYYANLELPFGASLDEVKRSYRRLMRQYHPDKHQSDPARRQLATALSQKLTVAYSELSRLLRKKKM